MAYRPQESEVNDAKCENSKEKPSIQLLAYANKLQIPDLTRLAGLEEMGFFDQKTELQP